jgi:lysozyme
MKNATKGLIAGSVALTALATGFVSHWEGRSLQAYRDIVGVWTICEGETKGVKPGDVATPAECDGMLARNIRTYEAGVDSCLKVAVPGKVKVAIVDLAINMGVGAVCGSTLIRLANVGDLAGACDQLLEWNKARVNGRLQVVRGLTLRRQAAREMCLEGVAGK